MQSTEQEENAESTAAGPPASVYVQTSHQGVVERTLVQDAADKMAVVISRRQLNSTALAAIIEVHIETTVITSHISTGRKQH